MFMIHSKKENAISHLHYISGDRYIKEMAFNKIHSKGYHYFKTIWQSKENEVLVCQFENGNSYDKFAIKTCDQKGIWLVIYPAKSLVLQRLSLIVV